MDSGSREEEEPEEEGEDLFVFNDTRTPGLLLK
jgi:hypothetical protein